MQALGGDRVSTECAGEDAVERPLVKEAAVIESAMTFVASPARLKRTLGCRSL